MLIELTKSDVKEILSCISATLARVVPDDSASYAKTEELQHRFAGVFLETECKHEVVDKVTICLQCRDAIELAE